MGKQGQCLCLSRLCHRDILEDRGVCLFPSPPTQFVELIHSLIVSKTKSQPNPTSIYNTDGREEGRGGERYNATVEVLQKTL